MANSVPSQLLAAIKARKWPTAARLFAPDVQFEAWTNLGHWVAEDPQTVGRILEAWFTPGAGSSVVWTNETAGARGAATLEYEIHWTAPPDDQPRALRQVYLLTIKGEKITAARVYCPGLHAEFPDVDLDKQRRQKGLPAPPPPKASGQKVAAKAS